MFWQMRKTFSRALAPGTIKNRNTQAALYIKFMMTYGFDYIAPSISELSMYSQFLANSYSSPATIKNHLSGAKSWVNLHGGSPAPFLSQELGMMCKAITEKSHHVPAPAAPLSPHDIRIICEYIDSRQDLPPAIKSSILIAYATFLSLERSVTF